MVETKYQKSIVYKIVSKDENETNIYVGSTIRLEKRIGFHLSDCLNTKKKSYKYRVYKHIRETGGFSNWEFEIVERYSCTSRKELCVREGYWVKELGAKLNTYQPGRTKEQYREDTKDEKKKYREEHKEHASEVAKKRYDIKRDEILAKDKIYREVNKEKIAERDAEKFFCECGGHYTRGQKGSHLKTNKHQNFLNNVEKVIEYDCECGSHYSHKKRSRHLKTIKHQTYLNEQSLISTV
jgi:hypothetical protein